MKWQKWTFSFFDTCFFRNPSPFNAGEGGYAVAQTAFPPTMFTVQGAIRTSLALEQGWHPGDERRWPEELGGSDDIGKLRFCGPYLCLEDQIYFATPLFLLGRGDAFTRLAPGEEVECDLGLVRLPVPLRPIEGAKALGESFISRDGLASVLEGGTPRGEDVKDREYFWAEEPRVGLERQDAKRTALEGHLYSCVHIRPRSGVKLVVFVAGIPEGWNVCSRRILTLGGEGRLAAAEVEAGDPSRFLPPAPRLMAGSDGKLRFTVTLLTPGWYGGPVETEGVIRQGPPGVPGRCVSACVGKAMQLGGWDLLNQRPRPLVSVLPPGSTWFYECEPELAEELLKLHGKCLSPLEAYGFGQIAIGRWEEKWQ